jgi:FkbM family methyltransferase
MKIFSIREIKYFVASKIPILYGVFNGLKKLTFIPTYSQFAEDLFAKKYLPEKFGIYVDVGGGHPIIGSNTYLFSRRGYSGVIIEPISKFANGFEKRPKVKVYQTVCSETEEKIDFYEFKTSFVSTTSELLAERLIENGEKLISKKSLLPIALRDLGLTSMPDYPSLLDIDVEGADLLVLKSNDWRKFKPRVILIESFGSSGDEIKELLELHDYKYVQTCDLTMVFVSKSYLALLQ